jgi:hypothetical protein
MDEAFSGLAVCLSVLVPSEWRRVYVLRRREQLTSALILHLIIRVDEILVVFLLIVITELLVGLGEVDVLAACAGVDDIGRVDLLHVILVGLLDCLIVRSMVQARVAAKHTFTGLMRSC